MSGPQGATKTQGGIKTKKGKIPSLGGLTKEAVQGVVNKIELGSAAPSGSEPGAFFFSMNSWVPGLFSSSAAPVAICPLTSQAREEESI